MGDYSALLWVALVLTGVPFLVGAIAAVYALREEKGGSPPDSH